MLQLYVCVCVCVYFLKKNLSIFIVLKNDSLFSVAMGEMLGCHFFRQQVPNIHRNYTDSYDYENQLPIFFFYKILPPLINGLIFPYLFESFIFSNVPPYNMCEILSKAF